MNQTPTSSLTGASVLAEAERLLSENGYVVDCNAFSERFGSASALLAEDPYGLVAVVAFENWSDLSHNWAAAQGALVDIIEKKIGLSDPKAWEGYLVLFCTGIMSPADEKELNQIRSDITRIRKLVVAGVELTSLSDVERGFLPVMSIDLRANKIALGSFLEELRPRLASAVGNEKAVNAVLDAFAAGRPMLEALHGALEDEK